MEPAVCLQNRAPVAAICARIELTFEGHVADSHVRQRALARYSCRGVLQDTRIRSGLATTTAIARAGDVATFSRCGSYRNFGPAAHRLLTT